MSGLSYARPVPISESTPTDAVIFYQAAEVLRVIETELQAQRHGQRHDALRRSRDAGRRLLLALAPLVGMSRMGVPAAGWDPLARITHVCDLQSQ
jgi:hypothetical protein